MESRTCLRYLVLADPALRGAGLGQLHPEVLLQRAGRGQAAAALASSWALTLERGGHQLAVITFYKINTSFMFVLSTIWLE